MQTNSNIDLTNLTGKFLKTDNSSLGFNTFKEIYYYFLDKTYILCFINNSQLEFGTYSIDDDEKTISIDLNIKKHKDITDKLQEINQNSSLKPPFKLQFLDSGGLRVYMGEEGVGVVEQERFNIVNDEVVDIDINTNIPDKIKSFYEFINPKLKQIIKGKNLKFTIKGNHKDGIIFPYEESLKGHQAFFPINVFNETPDVKELISIKFEGSELKDLIWRYTYNDVHYFLIKGNLDPILNAIFADQKYTIFYYFKDPEIEDFLKINDLIEDENQDENEEKFYINLLLNPDFWNKEESKPNPPWKDTVMKITNKTQEIKFSEEIHKGSLKILDNTITLESGSSFARASLIVPKCSELEFTIEGGDKEYLKNIAFEIFDSNFNTLIKRGGWDENANPQVQDMVEYGTYQIEQTFCNKPTTTVPETYSIDDLSGKLLVIKRDYGKMGVLYKSFFFIDNQYVLINDRYITTEIGTYKIEDNKIILDFSNSLSDEISKFIKYSSTPFRPNTQNRDSRLIGNPYILEQLDLSKKFDVTHYVSSIPEPNWEIDSKVVINDELFETETFPDGINKLRNEKFQIINNIITIPETYSINDLPGKVFKTFDSYYEHNYFFLDDTIIIYYEPTEQILDIGTYEIKENTIHINLANKKSDEILIMLNNYSKNRSNLELRLNFEKLQQGQNFTVSIDQLGKKDLTRTIKKILEINKELFDLEEYSNIRELGNVQFKIINNIIYLQSENTDPSTTVFELTTTVPEITTTVSELTTTVSELNTTIPEPNPTSTSFFELDTNIYNSGESQDPLEPAFSLDKYYENPLGKCN